MSHLLQVISYIYRFVILKKVKLCNYWNHFPSFSCMLRRCPTIGVGISGLFSPPTPVPPSEVLRLKCGQWVTVWAWSPVAPHLEQSYFGLRQIRSNVNMEFSLS